MDPREVPPRECWTTPTLGYGVSYAVGNVLLTLWGSIMVALTYRG